MVHKVDVVVIAKVTDVNTGGSCNGMLIVAIKHRHEKDFDP
jgi:hypothetical protein